MQAAADRMFCPETPWFKRELYDDLVRAKGHTGDHKTFLVTHDQDCRHSYYLHTDDPEKLKYGGVGGKVDRRALPAGTDMHMPLRPVIDYVPIATRVPDCVQSSVEMFFATVKREFGELMGKHRAGFVHQGEACAPETVITFALQAFEKKGTVQLASKCWEHARAALAVWTTPIGDWVVINGHRYMGTGGNWVHKALRG